MALRARVLHDVGHTLVVMDMLVSCKSISTAYEFKVAPRKRIFVLDRTRGSVRDFFYTLAERTTGGEKND